MKIVISLGGSLINPGKINYNFLKEFKNTIKKFSGYKIVIVTGGGKIAREYIGALKDKSEKVRSLIGIKATKLNAMLVSNFLDNEVVVPDSLEEVGRILKRKNLVVCGALGYRKDMTSDFLTHRMGSLITSLIYRSIVSQYNHKNAKMVIEVK